jgi:hypothetical protein
MREKGVAKQDSRRRAKLAGSGAAVTAHLGFIHDVVMHQGGQVDEFDDRRCADQIRRYKVRTAPAAEEDQGGANALAGRINAIIGHGPDLRLKCIELPSQRPIKFGQMRRQQGENTCESMGLSLGIFHQFLRFLTKIRYFWPLFVNFSLIES